MLVHYITDTTEMVLWWPVSEMDWFPSSGNESDRASTKRSLLCLMQSQKVGFKKKNEVYSPQFFPC